jgi:hypothetical protein
MQPIEVIKDTLQKLKSGNSVIENSKLDIKREWYSNIPKKDWKFELAKDVCAMANSLDSEECHLIFGFTNKEPYLKNVEIPEDEAIIQQIIKSNVTPFPKINLFNVIVEGCSIYVLTIHSSINDMPYFASRPNRDQFIYIRRGSSTGLCTKEELSQIIKAKRKHDISVELEAQAIKSVMDIQYSIINGTLEDLESQLIKLDQYSEGYSFIASGKVLSALYDVESRIRGKECAELTNRVSEIARRALPIYNLVSQSKNKITEDQIGLLKQGLDLAREIGCRATRGQKLPKVLGAATNLLYDILRFSHLNGLTKINVETVKVFNELLKYTKESDFSYATRWLELNMDDAQAISGDELPNYTADLVTMFSM